MTPLPPYRSTQHLDRLYIGREVRYFDSLASTNDTAASLATEPALAGTVVVADHQTSGRGQHGRIWQSRAGASLLMSVVLHPTPDIRRPVILTAWAAVAVAEAVRTITGVQAKIKWPNDLLIRGKKVCGILIEQRVGTVVGIGLNLNQTLAEFAEAELPHATSLAVVSGTPVERNAVLQTVLRHLDEEYDRLVGGELIPLESDWKWRVGLLGRDVVADLADGSRVCGRLHEMAFDGVVIEATDGIRVIPPERVRHISDSSRVAPDSAG